MTTLAEWYDGQVEAAQERLALVTDALEGALRDVVFVKGRVKTRASFLEKAERKGYDDRTTQIHDLVGVRVVVSRQHLVQDVQRVIEATASQCDWRVLEVQHRGSEFENLGVPGYQAVHVVIATQPEDVATTVELQVMTMLQNAWAVLQHDLVYKGSSDPTHLRRATTLAGLLELAEQEFENLRLSMSGGLENLPAVLRTPRDAETLASALWPGRWVEGLHTHDWAAALLDVITDLGLTDRERLLDVLGDATDRTKLVAELHVWRPWMNAFVLTDLLLRLRIDDYFDKRAAPRTKSDPAARMAHQQELEQFWTFAGRS